MKSQGREIVQAQEIALNPDAPKKNCFYALQSWGDQESSLDMVTGMLKLFCFDVYALLGQEATLSFVTLLVAMKFEILPKILHETFSVSTQWVIMW